MVPFPKETPAVVMNIRCSGNHFCTAAPLDTEQFRIGVLITNCHAVMVIIMVVNIIMVVFTIILQYSTSNSKVRSIFFSVVP